MRIPAIRQRFYYLSPPQKKCSATGNTPTEQTRLELPSVYYPCSTVFGLANSSKLKTLFTYGLPCMYTGTTMIDPKKVSKMLKNKAFNAPIGEVMKRIEQFENSLMGTEANVYQILKEESKYQPEKTVSEVMQDLSVEYNGILRAQQAPVFQQLIIAAKELPEEYRYKFVQLMHETQDKLAGRPVEVKFSRPEFQYRLEKVQNDVKKMNNHKANRVMTKLIEVAEKLTKEDETITDEEKLKTVEFMEKILKTSVLRDNQSLKYIFANAKSRLRHEKILIPFNNKTFTYDLKQILLPGEEAEIYNNTEKLNEYFDKTSKNLAEANSDNSSKTPESSLWELKQRMIGIAESLPTSRTSTAAYIMKFAKEPSEKIVYRILWPSFATVEHLFPRACGGIDDMSNYGGACAVANSDLGCELLYEKVKRAPQTPIYCHKYVDRLIELYKQGVFDKHYIDKNYIEEFKNTVYEESKGLIVLDTSKLYE